jgi:hypothetical protein
MKNTTRTLLLLFLFLLIGISWAQENKPKTTVTVDSLNSGDVVLIGKLGSPIGTYHDIVASFGSPVAKGRAGQGGQILLKVTKVDGKELQNPIWISYFKSMTLKEYVLPDGTNIFSEHPRTHTLSGKTVSCRVYEDIAILEGGNNNIPLDESKKSGFDSVVYKSMLGIISINGTKE